MAKMRAALLGCVGMVVACGRSGGGDASSWFVEELSCIRDDANICKSALLLHLKTRAKERLVQVIPISGMNPVRQDEFGTYKLLVVQTRADDERWPLATTLEVEALECGSEPCLKTVEADLQKRATVAWVPLPGTTSGKRSETSTILRVFKP